MLTHSEMPFISRRLKTIPLPTLIKSEFLNTFKKWERASGADWTVARIKAFRDCLLNSYSDKRLSHKPEWFKTTKRGNLAGIWGKIFRIAMQSSKDLKAVTFLLNVYTTLTHRPYQTDIRSIGRSIMTPPCNTGRTLSRIYPALARLRLLHKVKCPYPVPLLQVMPKYGHSVRLPWEIESLFKGSYPLCHRDILERALGAHPKIEFDPKYDPMMDSAIDGYYGAMPHMTYIAHPDMTWFTGYVHITNEPGLKDRYFASPNQVIQRALDPLKVALGRVVKTLPWDCTFNQRKADSTILAALAESKEIHSVDLSKATDNFPWTFQKRVIEGLLGRYGEMGKSTYQSMQLYFDTVEKGSWLIESGSRSFAFPGWTKGQPLGLAPSFFTFTLSHGLLLFILNGMRWDKKFFVLGDDVIIFDNQLHNKYRKVLSQWEVPISDTKSFSSNHFAQFAGVSYTSDRAWWTPKWIQPTADNILDISAWWYPGLTKGLKDHRLIQWVLSLPEPYGIGRNPNGVSLDERFPDELAQAIVKREMDDELKVIPRATNINPQRITIAQQEIDPEYVYSILQVLEENPEVIPSIQPNRLSLYADSYLLKLLDGTDVPGYPTQKLRWSDPYSLGRLQSWKNLLRSFKK